MKIAQIADRVGWCSFVFILLISSNWNFRCWFRLTCRKCNAKIYFRFLLFAAASDYITLHKNVESILTKMICSLALLPIFRWLCFDFTEQKWWSSRIKCKKTLPFHSMRCTRAVPVTRCLYCQKSKQNKKRVASSNKQKSVNMRHQKSKWHFCHPLKTELIKFVVTKIESFVSFRCAYTNLIWTCWPN